MSHKIEYITTGRKGKKSGSNSRKPVYVLGVGRPIERVDLATKTYNHALCLGTNVAKMHDEICYRFTTGSVGDRMHRSLIGNFGIIDASSDMLLHDSLDTFYDIRSSRQKRKQMMSRSLSIITKLINADVDSADVSGHCLFSGGKFALPISERTYFIPSTKRQLRYEKYGSN